MVIPDIHRLVQVTAGSRLDRFVVLLVAVFASWPVGAHVSSLASHEHRQGETYTSLSFGRDRIHLLYTVPRKLAGKGVREPADFLPRVERSLLIANNAARCRVISTEANDYPAIKAWQYELQYGCDDELDEVEFTYNLFEDTPFHTNFVEFQIGNRFSTMAMGYNLRKTQVPIRYILWEQGWELPEKPAPLKGKVRSISDYFMLGYKHVLTGYDHVAFLLGLMIVIYQIRTILLLITSFTIAHSTTLALSALSVVTFSVDLTEAAIAFTIVYIGIENMWYLYRRKKDAAGAGYTLQRRWATTFCFGLIHGFAFSFILREVGLGQEQFVPALFLFNVGVEAGQISAVILPFLVIRHLLIELPHWNAVSMVCSVGIATIGGWWLVERTLSFWAAFPH